MFGLSFAAGKRPDIVKEVISRITSGEQLIVLTANLHITIRFCRSPVDERFRNACLVADMTVADGMPLVWASWLLGDPLPARVAGVDLMVDLCGAATELALSVFLFGAQPHVASRAAEVLKRHFPNLKISGIYSPPVGFENDRIERERALRTINAHAPDLLFVALGTPKAEHWISEVRSTLCTKMVMGVGGALDMVAGKFLRAPRLFQITGLEWLWRLVQDPVRLGKRYAKDAAAFPLLIWNEWRLRRRNR